MTHRGDTVAWRAGTGGKYRELVLEGNQGRLKKGGFRLKCTKRAGTVPFTEVVVIPCPSCLPSNIRASLCVKGGIGRKSGEVKKEWLPVEVHEASGNSSFHRNCGNSLSLLPSF